MCPLASDKVILINRSKFFFRSIKVTENTNTHTTSFNVDLDQPIPTKVVGVGEAGARMVAQLALRPLNYLVLETIDMGGGHL